MPKTPPHVYWLRRALVLGLAVVLVLGLVWLVSALTGDDATTTNPAPASAVPGTAETTTPAGEPTGDPSPTPTPSRAAASSVRPSVSAPGSATAPASLSASTRPSAAVSTSATSTGPVACAKNQVVVAVSGPKRVKVDTRADLMVSISNSGQVPCVLTLSAGTFRLQITSGSDEIWSTLDCPGWGPEGTFTVQPGESVDWRMSWERRRSQRGCKVVPGDLGAGTYVANAQYADGPSGRHVMLLVW